MVTEADILDDILAPDEGDFGEEAARAVLKLGFSDEAKGTIRDLLDRQNRDDLTGDEAATLKKYLRVGQLIDLLQAKARISLTK